MLTDYFACQEVTGFAMDAIVKFIVYSLGVVVTITFTSVTGTQAARCAGSWLFL